MSANGSKMALVLDFGGVISRTMFETHKLSEAALGLPAGILRWRGPFEPEGDALWRAMQAGDITEREYWLHRTQEVAGLIGKDWTRMDEFIRAARGADPLAVIRPEALASIAAAKRSGVRLAILSNELDLFYGADFRKRLPFLDDFELIVDATYSGILKPDPRAYQAVCDGLGIEAKQCVFVDDQPKNIQGAVTAGMIAVSFDVRDPAGSYKTALSHLNINLDLENENAAA